MIKSQFFFKIFRNWSYKLAALVIACIFWYLVQSEQVGEINRRIQINVEVPDGYLIRGSNFRFKDATLRGPRVMLSNFSNRPLEGTVKLEANRTGALSIRIDKSYIKNFPDRISLTVHDPYLKLYMDKKLSRTLPIRENLVGVPAEGFIIEKATTKPRMATITGLRADISKLRQISTEPISIEGIQASKSLDAELVVPGVNYADLSIEKSKVFLQVGEKKINKRYSRVPLEVEGAKFPTYVRPSLVSIEIQGTSGTMNFVRSGSLRAFVDVRDLGPGRWEKKIQVKIPPDTVLIETFPELATIDISKPKSNE